METTLALALLMGVGLLAAKLAQLLRLPSVTGFICAGLLLGPSALNIIKQEHLEADLSHFAQIALMLIAFGIGEHLDWRQLRRSVRSVGFISLFEAWGACLLVAGGTFAAAYLTRVGPAGWGVKEYLCLAGLLGGVATATAPAATFHVMRELRASGPLTRTLMAVVALDDGLAIIIFGVVLAVVGTVIGAAEHGLLMAIGKGLVESVGSVLVGIACGLLIDLFVHRLKRRGEMLTAGLALILLGGEVARLLGLSPLLAGMGAGFTIVNRDRRDVRVFRTINDFEPPIYALFFTLAGAHLKLSALVAAGVVGIAYALLRVLGKMAGAWTGARIAASPDAVRKYLGFALVPQAGVAIGLVFLIQSNAELHEYATIITPVVLAGVVLSELFGPVAAKFAVVRAGEAGLREPATPLGADSLAGRPMDSIELVPWTWPQLSPAEVTGETVVFGVRHPLTAAPVGRISTLLAHHYSARPLSVAVLTGTQTREYRGSGVERETENLFVAAREEVAELGYPLLTCVEFADSVAEGLLKIARDERARAIVLGHPLGGGAKEFRKVVDTVAARAEVPVVVVRFSGPLHTERILVPVGEPEELGLVQPLVQALSTVWEHEITVLQLLSPGAGEDEVRQAEEALQSWVQEQGVNEPVTCRAQPADSRLEAILEAAGEHDVIAMALDRSRGLRRAFFGSLAEEVAMNCRRPILLVGGKVAPAAQSSSPSGSTSREGNAAE
jgi:Kef-type K+ transport system membrane component KefB/nucleotide-binding universal stress UspA family protein